jgi:hypothetical protein
VKKRKEQEGMQIKDEEEAEEEVADEKGVMKGVVQKRITKFELYGRNGMPEVARWKIRSEEERKREDEG